MGGKGPGKEGDRRQAEMTLAAKWARSPRRTEESGTRPYATSYCWHLASAYRPGTAFCHIRVRIQSDFVDQPPPGARLCLDCMRRMETAKGEVAEDKR